ncbi:hypothetical protein [Lentilactobacillus parabuchneri]|uniref:hypothetical protein n=1 Tax=Lentilactobacillus parabuchneri TaxID=152331 RepID=UPI00070A00CD|nr:hypothetical protein [Lentilactobacillus parabuchneri]KRN74421.1 hypothetical protein IV42_GL001040 [Lentilactobacillus parabuchneri]
MSKWIKGFVFGLGVCIGLSLFGVPSTAHANYGTKLTYGYKVPKALHGKWYFGNQKAVFTGTYKKYRTGKEVITRHLVKGTCYANGKHYRVKLYYDGLYYGHSLDFGCQYVPIIFSYHGHNHKGLDVSGQAPDDVIYTRKNFHNTLSLNKYGNYHKVKLVHFGF